MILCRGESKNLLSSKAVGLENPTFPAIVLQLYQLRNNSALFSVQQKELKSVESITDKTILMKVTLKES